MNSGGAGVFRCRMAASRSWNGFGARAGVALTRGGRLQPGAENQSHSARSDIWISPISAVQLEVANGIRRVLAHKQRIATELIDNEFRKSHGPKSMPMHRQRRSCCRTASLRAHRHGSSPKGMRAILAQEKAGGRACVGLGPPGVQGVVVRLSKIPIPCMGASAAKSSQESHTTHLAHSRRLDTVASVSGQVLHRVFLGSGSGSCVGRGTGACVGFGQGSNQSSVNEAAR